MNHSTSLSDIVNFAIYVYFELRQIYDKNIIEISKYVIDKIYNYKVYYANNMIDWSNKEINNYMNIYTTPDSSNMLKVTDLEKVVSLWNEMNNIIYKEACLFIMNIINKYFNI